MLPFSWYFEKNKTNNVEVYFKENLYVADIYKLFVFFFLDGIWKIKASRINYI